MAPTRTNAIPPASEDMLARNGRQLTRMVDMFWNTSAVINTGKQLHKMSDEDELRFRENASEKQLRELALIDKLNELDPALFDQLTQPGPHAGRATRDVKSQLSTGQSNGKAEDMRKVKEWIGKWRKWDPPLPPADEKAARGLNHEECAFLLSDSRVDWTNRQAITQFMAFNNPPMDASDWPRLLCPYGQFDPTRPSEGLLKSELMIKATANDPDTTPANLGTRGAQGSAARRRGTIGIAKTYQLTEVTRPFICYVAVVLRHALTSDETFGDVCAGFNYIEFYEQLLEFLQSPKFEQTSNAIVAWWNEQLFSSYHLGQATGPSNRRALGTLASLEAEQEATAGHDAPAA